MEDWPTLALITSLLEEHQAGPDGAQLITCMHHDVDGDIPLLTAAAERYNGQLYFLSADDHDWVDPPGPINATRRGIVEGIIQSITGALPGPLEIREEHGLVTASISGHPGPVASSLKPLLRAIAVMTSDALQRTDISLVVASVVEADDRRRELLWRILNPDPSILGLPGRRTIISVLSGKPDPDFDFARTPPLRYIALADRILKRTDSATQSALRTITTHQGPVILFLGAGASASAGVSLGNAYRDTALEDLLGDTSADSRTLADAFFHYLQDRNRFLPGERANRADFIRSLTLERVLRETFHELGARPRSDTRIVQQITRECDDALSTNRRGRVAIHHLIENFPGRLVVITVNFDQLIETGVETLTRSVFTPEQFQIAHDDIRAYLNGDKALPVPILKLHGSIEDPTSLIATIDSTAPGLHNDVRAVLDTVMRTGPVPTPWIWIGCSMRDRDVNDWLRSLGYEQLDEWWVDPFPGESLDRFVQESREPGWRRDDRTLQDRLIIESADRFLSKLDEHMRH